MMAKHLAPFLVKGNGAVGFKDGDGKPRHAAILVIYFLRKIMDWYKLRN